MLLPILNMAQIVKNIFGKLKSSGRALSCAGVFAVILFGAFAKYAHALDLSNLLKISVSWAVGEVGVFFVNIISYLLTLAQLMFQFALMYNLRFGNKMEIVKIGWNISRDIANIFLIVILLVISIATILRISGYAAKQLLTKLIFMAILINFSLTIGLVVVDFSNTLGVQFYNALTDNNTRSVSSLIMIGTGLQHVFDFRDPTAGTMEAFSRGTLQVGAETLTSYAASPRLMDAIKKGQSEDFTAFAITAWGNAIFMSVLVFVFFVGTILLLVRVAVIATLLILAPIAFLFYILPDTQKYFNQWWSTLTQHCFFLPTFLFLLYFAVVFIIKVGIVTSAGVTGNFIDNPQLIFAYILAIILLIQAIIIGRSMSIIGAGTAIGWAKDGRKMLTGFVGSNTVGWAAGRIRTNQKVQDFVDRRSPWLGTFMQNTLKRGQDVGGKYSATAQAGKIADFVMRKTPEEQAKDFAKMNFAQKQALLSKMNTEQRRRLMSQLPDEQRKLAERIAGTTLGSDQKADMDAATYQRMQGTEDEKQKAFVALSKGAKERVLRTMNQKEQADFVGKLRGNKDLKPRNATDIHPADDVETMLRESFSPNEYVGYKVEKFKRQPIDQQLQRFNGSITQEPELDARTR